MGYTERLAGRGIVTTAAAMRTDYGPGGATLTESTTAILVDIVKYTSGEEPEIIRTETVSTPEELAAGLASIQTMNRRAGPFTYYRRIAR